MIYKSIARIGDIIRYVYYKLILRKLGWKSFIKSGVRIIGNPRRISIGENFKIWQRCILIVNRGNISIGSNGLIGVDSLINASKGNVVIGNNVAIAPKVQIFSYSHYYSIGRSMNECYLEADVKIEDNVFVGAGAIIMPGITIKEGSIIAAGAVVNRDVKKHTIVGGVPAKVIKKLKQ